MASPTGDCLSELRVERNQAWRPALASPHDERWPLGRGVDIRRRDVAGFGPGSSIKKGITYYFSQNPLTNGPQLAKIKL